MTTRQGLLSEARKAGVAWRYRDATGVVREAPVATIRAVVDALNKETPQSNPKSTSTKVRPGLLRSRLHPSHSGCYLPKRATGIGIWMNLYTLRSETNWGVGDMGDLRRVIRWAARLGAQFVGINPLHALWNQQEHISPYSPITRLFRNPIYIDVADAAKMSGTSAAYRKAIGGEMGEKIKKLRDRDTIDYAGTWSAKRETLWSMFQDASSSPRRESQKFWKEFLAYAAREGPLLSEFAAYIVDRETPTKFDHRPTKKNRDDRTAKRRSPEAPPAHDPRLVEFQKFLQYLVDEQLRAAQELALQLGMTVGLYGDLPIASSADGFDAQQFHEHFAFDMDLGCPPDAYQPQGQNWSMAPQHPRRWAQNPDFWRAILSSSMKHMGMIRLDHVIGLRRQFWIPKGASASEGAYVQYPFDAIVHIAASESMRHRTIVVGEDLGTTPRGFSALMKKKRALSTRVLYFQRNKSGEFLASRRYEQHAFTSATTHDHPPLAGWWEEFDVREKVRHGMISKRQAAAEGRLRAAAKEALVRRLSAEGLRFGATPSAQDIMAACTSMLAMSPSRFVGVSLDDLALEKEPVNYPGVPPSVHPSWLRKMSKSLTAIEQCSWAADVVRTAVAIRSKQP